MEHPGRILAIVLLAISLIAADHLYYLRRPREILIKGSLYLEPDQPIRGVQVDTEIRFRHMRVKVRPDGQQSVALGAADVWALKRDCSTPYSVLWRQNGRFELTVLLWGQGTPRTCRLIFSFPNGVQLKGKRFRLKTNDRRRLQWSGQSPPMVLAQLPVVPARALRRPRPLATSMQDEEEPGLLGGPLVEYPELNMRESAAPISEEEVIRNRAESALLHINTLSSTALRLRYQLIEYLESNPAFRSTPTTRTKEIGMLLRDILNRRRELLGRLSNDQPDLIPPSLNLDEDIPEDDADAPPEKEEEDEANGD